MTKYPRKGRRAFIRGLAFSALSAAALSVAVPAVAQEGNVKFGVSLPMTGDFAEYGEFILNGVKLAVDQANAKGGVDGKSIELVVEDSRGDPKEAVLIAERFVGNPEILLQIGDFTSSSSMAAAPIYEGAGMAQVAPTSSHPDFSTLGENMIRVVAMQQAESQYLARWAAGDLGVKKVATIYVNNDWGLVANKAFADEARTLGMEVLTEEAITPGEKDFAAVVTKIKNMEPDALYIAAQYAEAAAILGQARRARFKPLFINSGAPQSPELIELAGKATEGLVAAALYFTDNPEPVSAGFTRDFETAYGKHPNLFAALGYDAGLLAVHGARNAGSERTAVAPAILGLSGFQGATGGFDYTVARDPVKEYARTTVRDGKWVIYE